MIVSPANLLAETSLPETRKTHSSLVPVLIPARNEEHNIGSLLEDLKDYTSAQKVYEFITRTEPAFIYVSGDLYPKLLKQMQF
ncbi:MAG: hypothetical protein WAW07_07765 [Bacteroidales bacterium]